MVRPEKPKKNSQKSSPKPDKAFKKITQSKQGRSASGRRPSRDTKAPAGVPAAAPASFSPPTAMHAGVSFAPVFELPAHYGDDKIVLLVRDPWWIYAYWEVTEGRQARAREEIRRQGLEPDKLALRVYDVTGASIEAPRSFFDIEVVFLASNWYIDVGIPDRDWVAELGLRTRDGRFFPLVRSNVVRTPRFGVSDVIDEEWMVPDEIYWKLFGLSGGLADRRSSLDVREILEKYLRSIASSEGLSSFSQSAKMIRNESRMDINAKILESL